MHWPLSRWPCIVAVLLVHTAAFSGLECCASLCPAFFFFSFFFFILARVAFFPCGRRIRLCRPHPQLQLREACQAWMAWRVRLRLGYKGAVEKVIYFCVFLSAFFSQSFEAFSPLFKKNLFQLNPPPEFICYFRAGNCVKLAALETSVVYHSLLCP